MVVGYFPATPLPNNDLRELISPQNNYHKAIVYKTLNNKHGCKLPTRVIQVKLKSDTGLVKLIRCRHLVGCYCALSHCWGPLDKRSYTTI
jgi:hypothetical protein